MPSSGLGDVVAFEASLGPQDRESNWLAIMAEAKNASNCVQADMSHKWMILESSMRPVPSDFDVWLDAMNDLVSEVTDLPASPEPTPAATCSACAAPAAQADKTAGPAPAAAAPGFSLFAALPAELQHKILLDSVEPATFEAGVRDAPNWFGLCVHISGATIAGRYQSVRHFASIPLYGGVDREARALATASFGQPSRDTFPFNPHTDTLRLDLSDMVPRPSTVTTAAAGGRRWPMTFLRPAAPATAPAESAPPPSLWPLSRGAGRVAPVRAAVLGRIRAVTLRVPQAVGWGGALEGLHCDQEYLGGGNGAMRDLVRLLARMLPNLERLTVEFFRGDDCLFCCEGALRFVGYCPERDGLFDTRVLDLLDALEGGGVAGRKGEVRCPFPRLKTLRLVVKGGFCSYMLLGGGLLCCSVAVYVPVVKGERASLVGKSQWWSGEDGKEVVGDHDEMEGSFW